MVHLGEDKLPSVLKIWPEALAVSAALSSPNLYFLKTGKKKTISNGEEHLKQFISYYVQCQQGLTPLVPDWADALLRKKPADFSDSFTYEDPVNTWIKERLEMPSVDILFQEWGWLRETFQGLIALYPSRLAKEEDETV